MKTALNLLSGVFIFRYQETAKEKSPKKLVPGTGFLQLLLLAKNIYLTPCHPSELQRKSCKTVKDYLYQKISVKT